MADIKLVYFSLRGRAEPLRLTMVAAGKKFEDYKFGMEQLAAEKEKSPYGVVPYLVYKGKTYGESKAIASFLARECGLAGKTSEEAMRVDEVYCLVGSLLEAIGKVSFEKDDAKKSEGQKELADVTVPKFLGYFEKMLKENGKGYLAGSALTQADLSVYDILDTILGKSEKILDKYPELQKMRKNVEANANVKAYLASRPKADM